jgi:hypothetical protein
MSSSVVVNSVTLPTSNTNPTNPTKFKLSHTAPIFIPSNSRYDHGSHDTDLRPWKHLIHSVDPILLGFNTLVPSNNTELFVVLKEQYREMSKFIPTDYLRYNHPESYTTIVNLDQVFTDISGITNTNPLSILRSTECICIIKNAQEVLRGLVNRLRFRCARLGPDTIKSELLEKSIFTEYPNKYQFDKDLFVFGPVQDIGKLGARYTRLVIDIMALHLHRIYSLVIIYHPFSSLGFDSSNDDLWSVLTAYRCSLHNYHQFSSDSPVVLLWR